MSVKRRREILRLGIPISTLALVETIAWMTLAAYYLTIGSTTFGLVSMMMVITWGYTFVRPLLRPSATPPYDILTLLVVQLMSGLLGLFGHAYDKYAYSKTWPSGWVFIGEIVDLTIICTLLSIIIHTPIELLDDEDTDPLSPPEDRASVWGWMTFGFVNPLIEKVLHVFFVLRDSNLQRPLGLQRTFE